MKGKIPDLLTKIFGQNKLRLLGLQLMIQCMDFELAVTVHKVGCLETLNRIDKMSAQEMFLEENAKWTLYNLLQIICWLETFFHMKLSNENSPFHNFLVIASELHNFDPEVRSFTESSWDKISPNVAMVSAEYCSGHS